MATLIGQGYVEIVPKIVPNFGSQLTAQLVGMTKTSQTHVATEMQRAGQQAGNRFVAGLRSGMSGMSNAMSSFAGSSVVNTVKQFATQSVDAFKSVATESLALKRVMGGTIEQASAWRAVGERYGLTSQQMSVAMKTLSKDMTSAKGPLQTLGVQVKDTHGAMLPMGDVLLQVADKFKAMPDGAEKSRLAVQLFGKQGLSLLPVLNQGKGGIQAFMDKAKDMGLVLDSQATDKVKALNANQRILGMSMEGLKVSLGQNLLPIFAKFAEFMATRVMPVVKTVADFFERNKAVMVPLVTVVLSLAAAMKVLSVITAIVNAVMAINPFVAIGMAVVALTVAIIYLWNHWNQVWEWISHHKGYAILIAALVPIVIPIMAIVGAVRYLWQNWDSIWKSITGALSTAWAAIYTGLHAIQTGFMTAWNAIWVYIGPVMRGIQTVVSVGMGVIRAVWDAGWLVITTILKAAWAVIGPIVRVGMALIGTVIGAGMAVLRAVWTVAWTVIKTVLTVIWDVMKTVVTVALALILAPIKATLIAIQAIWGVVWGAISAFLTFIWGIMKGIVWDAITWVRDRISTVLGVISGVWNTVWGAISGFVHDRWEDIKNTVGAALVWVWQKIQDAGAIISDGWSKIWTSIKQTFEGIWNGIKTVFKDPLNIVIFPALRGFAHVIDAITDFVGLGRPLQGVEDMKNLQKGARLPGYGGGDIIPAMLEPGEAVIPKHLVGEMAPWAKQKGIPGFADGGVVGVPLWQSGAPGPINQGAWWDNIPGVGVVKNIVKGVGNIGSDVLGAIADAAKWVYEKGVGVFRMGAAGALEGLLAGPEAAMDLAVKPFGKPGEMFDKGVHKALQGVVDWVRGKEGPDPSAGGSGGGVADSNAVVAFAKSLIGSPYRPPYYDPSGFSCDGFVWYVFKHFGIDLPRGATNQMNAVQRLGAGQQQPGDVVGFHQNGPSSGNPLGLEFHHIGLVTGADQMIDALGTAYGVRVDSISGVDSGPGHYVRFGRVLQNLNPNWGKSPSPGTMGTRWSQNMLESAAGQFIDRGAAHLLGAIAMEETGGYLFPTTNQFGVFHGPWAFMTGAFGPIDYGRLDTDLNYAALQAVRLYQTAPYGPTQGKWENWASRVGPYMTQGGLVRSYDTGGYLPPGLSLAWNGTGKPEQVGGGTQNTVNLTINVANGDPQTIRTVAQQVVDDALTTLARKLSSGAGRN